MDREIKEIILATRDFKVSIKSYEVSQKNLYNAKSSLDNHETVDTVLKVDFGSIIYYLNNFEYGKVIYKGE